MNIYFREAKNADDFNAAYAKYFPQSKPARISTGAELF
jgi:2-iminobutanoate/2-iminopropanoate deaminase